MSMVQDRAAVQPASPVRRYLERHGGLYPAAGLIVIFLLIPLCFILGYSFMEADAYGGVKNTFSLEAYQSLIYERRLDDSLALTTSYILIAWRSIMIAGLTTLITLCVGLPVAVYIARQSPQHRNLLLLLVTIPFWTNILIRTFAWILLLRDTGLINGFLLSFGAISSPIPMLNTDGAILVGLIYTFAPFMVLPIYGRVEKIDHSLFEAAHDLYASRWHLFREVLLPLAKPGIIAGSLLTFIPCLGSLIAPELLGGGKKLMLGSLIYRQFGEARNWPFGAALSVVLLSIVILIGIIHFLRVRRSAKTGG